MMGVKGVKIKIFFLLLVIIFLGFTGEADALPGDIIYLGSFTPEEEIEQMHYYQFPLFSIPDESQLQVRMEPLTNEDNNYLTESRVSIVLDREYPLSQKRLSIPLPKSGEKNHLNLGLKFNLKPEDQPGEYSALLELGQEKIQLMLKINPWFRIELDNDNLELSAVR